MNDYIFADPTAEALSAMDIRGEIFDDVRDILSDSPQELRDKVRGELKQFKTLEQLEAVQKNGIHKTLAYAAIGNAARTGQQSSAAKSAAPTAQDRAMNEALASRTVAASTTSGIPSAFRQEQLEVCRVLGVTLTEQELQDAYRNRR